ncbi:hypothetical protein [Paenibacillus sp. IITD108]|uniref:hypothetical protein n=1 Tax=Paenibacillus sp. IITD108 TaxID=3116649 RepID=UPI002F3EE171
MKCDIYLVESEDKTLIEWMQLDCIYIDWDVKVGDFLLLDEDTLNNINKQYPRLRNQLFFRVDKVDPILDDECPSNNFTMIIVKSM